jgi:heptaprenyl diphosphate synthase
MKDRGLKTGQSISQPLQREQLRRLTQDAMLVSLALVLAIVERWIPLELLVPIPGLKLGLANIVTLVALLRLRPADAVIILLVRIIIMGTITGLTAMLFSLGGGILALLIMWLLSHWEGRLFSAIGISLAGAAAHNIGQVLVAGLVMGEPLLIVTYLPALLLTAIGTGLLTGVAAVPVLQVFARLPALGTQNPPSQPGDQR